MNHRIAALLLLAPIAASTAMDAHAAKAETYYMYVLNEPTPEREVEYNDWYSNRHAPDVISIPGFVSAQRYVASEHQLRPDAKPPVKYMIEFKIVTDDLAAVMGEVNRRIRDGVTVISDVIGKGPPPGSSGGGTYKTITDVVPGKGGDVPGARKGPRTHYIQVVYATATPGKEREFNDWYTNVHAPSVAATPGFQQWQRMQVSPVAMGGRGPSPNTAAAGTTTPSVPAVPSTNGYMIKFDIETSDIEAVFARYMQDLRASKLPDLGDAGKIGAGYTYRAIGAPISADAVRKARARKGCVIVNPTAPCP